MRRRKRLPTGRRRLRSSFGRSMMLFGVILTMMCIMTHGFVVHRQSRIKSHPLLSSESSCDDREVKFVSPLLEYGYRPAVEAFQNGTLQERPLLLYLPGFDGTFICPFLQFPELGTVFDVRCMTVGANDRSTFAELRERVLDYLREELGDDDDTEIPFPKEVFADKNRGGGGGLLSLVGINRGSSSSKSSSQMKQQRRSLYLAGESFGGMLATEVAISIAEDPSSFASLNLQGLTLINAATCYDRSKLAAEGPKVVELPLWLYPVGLMKLLPLFTDEYSVKQLLLILQGKALPSIIDTAAREAYMGRVALSLPFVIPVLSRETFHWRLTAWLETACDHLATRLRSLQVHGPTLCTLIVAGEDDRALPSIDEAERLASILPNPTVFVVEDAGHASTCGSRVDLAALFRASFPELRGPTSRKKKGSNGCRIEMKPQAAAGKGEYLGMEPRYDGNTIGLNPLSYWSRKYFLPYKQEVEGIDDTII